MGKVEGGISTLADINGNFVVLGESGTRHKKAMEVGQLVDETCEL